MPDNPAHLPAIVRQYAAYMEVKAHITPQTSVNGAKAEIRVSTREKALVLAFGCRRKKWTLRTIDVRHGEQVTSFIPGELTEAVAALLGREAPVAARQPIDAASGPGTDAALRERRNTVIRV